jgi:predicted molibdopterin-dependent oxidoreductase YjgC
LRVLRHPVLVDAAGPEITIFFDGKEIPAKKGEPIAAALLAAGVRVFRETAKRGYPRGIYCGIGRCTDCVMIVDGQPNVRTCVTEVKPGMRVEIQKGLGRWVDET